MAWGKGSLQPGCSVSSTRIPHTSIRRGGVPLGSSHLLASDLRLFPVNSITFNLQERSQQETSGHFLFYETQFDDKSPECPGGQPFLEDVGLPCHFGVLWGSLAAAAEDPHLLMPAVENTLPLDLWVRGSLGGSLALACPDIWINVDSLFCVATAKRHPPGPWPAGQLWAGVDSVGGG